MKTVFIFTGGTIGSVKQSGVISPNAFTGYTLLDEVQKRVKLDEIDMKNPYNILSENMCMENINLLRDCICETLKEGCDGVIVTHGTDTLQYTACFLSYLFGSDTVPIVLVSANYPLGDPRSNGVDNCAAAVEFIRGGYGKGVFVSYKNASGRMKIHRASRVLPHDAYSDDLRSVNGLYYGEFIDGKFVKNPAYRAYPDEVKAVTDITMPELTDEIEWLRPYTGLSYPALGKGVRAVLHDCYHSGTVRTDGGRLKAFADELRKKNIPLYLTGAYRVGDIYASMREYGELGVKVLPHASPVAMFCKLWLMLAGQLGEEFLFSSLGEDVVPD